MSAPVVGLPSGLPEGADATRSTRRAGVGSGLVGRLAGLVERLRQVDWEALVARVETLLRENAELRARCAWLERRCEALRRGPEVPPGAGPGSPPTRDLAPRGIGPEAAGPGDPAATPPDDRDELARRRVADRGLVRVGRLALGPVDAEGLVDTVLHQALESLAADATVLVLQDDDRLLHRQRGEPRVAAWLLDRLRAPGEPGPGSDRLAAGPCEAHGPCLILPLVGSEGAAGALCLGRTATRPGFTGAEEELALALAQLTALALDRSRQLQRVEAGVLDAVACFVAALESKDPDLQGHSARVSLYAGEIATALGLAPAEVAVCRRAGLLHDLGKLLVPDAIRLKPARLTDDEYATVRGRTAAAATILRPLPFLSREAAAVRHHLERFDGTGFPAGLRGPAIPVAARVVAVADALDAMTTDRPYRTAVSLEAALAELARHAGSQFDPAAVRALDAIPRDRLAAIAATYRHRPPPPAPASSSAAPLREVLTASPVAG